MGITEIVELRNHHRLLRRAFFTDPRYVKDDMTVSSFAFTLRKGETGLSVDIEHLTSYAKSIQDPVRFRLFAVSVELVRSVGLDCAHKPMPENAAHAEIFGDVFNKRKSSLLAKNAVYINFP